MFSNFQYRTDKIQDFFISAMIPCGLVARIRRFHRRGRGSIPRKGGSTFLDTFSEHGVNMVAMAAMAPCIKRASRREEMARG